MENNSYEEYIRSVLGYPNNNYSNYNYNNNSNNNMQSYNELEECYPEIYKQVYPMVKRTCNSRSGNVSREDIDRMVDEIYNSLEGNINYVQVENRNISKTQEVVKEQKEPRYFNGKRVIQEPVKEMPNRDIKQDRIKEMPEKRETRQCKNCNRSLRDIIRILLLRELIGRPGFPGNRPPFPPPGGRPPFPPPGPGGRPPFNRTWNDDLYELY